ncbi:C-type lectin domain family 10 member A-like [Carassius carassius]|uniref:C-type lectin domain family 10 member A-like n=1 Tax=Carassius carassius TaxID=217509 RepID=UPI0028689F09|nr:C-type lectin domain family 10 member A-like [Carassius carassius]
MENEEEDEKEIEKMKNEEKDEKKEMENEEKDEKEIEKEMKNEEEAEKDIDNEKNEEEDKKDEDKKVEEEDEKNEEEDEKKEMEKEMEDEKKEEGTAVFSSWGENPHCCDGNKENFGGSSRYSSTTHSKLRDMLLDWNKVLLCVLLLTAVIVLCVTLTQERQQFITKNENLTNEREQLTLKITNLTNEREQLILKNTNLTNEREQLILKNTNLTNELRICVGWTCYQSSFYYMSKEKKNWTESRRYCTERGADLIIINNREEKDFIHNMSGNAVFYIGLTDSEVEGRWKWADGSTLTPGVSFWASGDPNGGQVGVEEDCVVTVAVPPPEWGDRVGWLDVACDKTYQWICEKRISQFILP